jgi:mRNA interferase YafQ
LTTWGCNADPGAIDAVQKGREKGSKTRQRFGQTEVATEFADSPDDVTRGVSGSSVAGELEGVPGPDWLLLYRVDGEELQLARTGTHADLFQE